LLLAPKKFCYSNVLPAKTGQKRRYPLFNMPEIQIIEIFAEKAHFFVIFLCYVIFYSYLCSG
jgi:hypothetical protein